MRVPDTSVAAAHPRRRGRLVALALAATFAAPMAFGAAPSAASHAPPSCTSPYYPGPLCLQVVDIPDPVSYSEADGNESFVAYDSTVSNQSGDSTLHNVTLGQDLPVDEGEVTLLSEGYSGVVGVSTSQGECFTEGSSVYCDLGDLGPGEEALVRVKITAPAAESSNAEDTVITDYATASFYNPFGGEGGVFDSASYDEDTTVTNDVGQTYVPAGENAQVGTDPDDPQYANVSITNATEDLFASIEILPPDNFCQNGRVRVGLSVYVCRGGSFARASVTEVDDGSQYFNARDPLVFHLRWDDQLVSPLQTKKNFVAFYQSHVGAKTQVIKKRCGGFLPKLPCVTNIELHADGSLEADLVKPDNGRMR